MPTKIDNTVHNYLGKILTTKKDFRRGIYWLKNSENFPVICKTADRLLNVSMSYHKYLYGNPLPQTIETIGVLNNRYYSRTLNNELDWFLLSLRKYRGELSIFLTMKNDFENLFIIGKYQEALEVVDKSIDQIGYSTWAIASKLLIFEYTASQDKAKLLQTEILEKNEEGVFTSSLINFISQRSERRLSAYKYDSDLKSSLNNLKSNIDKSNRDYYNFQLNFFENDDFTELKDILGFDYYNSIIDRYLTFRRLLFYSVCNKIDTKIIAEKISYLLKKVPDDLFSSICILSNEDPISDLYYDNEYLRIIDLYYSGLYEELIEEVKQYFRNNSVNFTLMNLYARSLVFINSEFSMLIEGPCLANEITKNIYKIYQKTSTPSEPLYSLYQASKNLDNFDINYQLNSFIKFEQNIKFNVSYFYLSLPKADPKIVELLVKSPDLVKDVLEKIKSKTFHSISINYKLKILNEDFDSIEGISNTKSIIDKAKYYFYKKDFELALKSWQEIYKNNQNIPPIYETATGYIFNILTETQKLDESIKWYVDCFLNNPFAVYKIDTKAIHHTLRAARFKNVSINIYLPIFISLISSDENEKSFAVELFCKQNDAIFPCDLIEKTEIQKDKYFEIFFSNSCSDDTLTHYKFINTTKRRLEERINICNYLATAFPDKKDTYIQELNLLTNELIIYEGTQKLDDSKIYANDQAILNKELDEYEGLYKRYMTIASLYLKNLKILTVNRNELRYLNKKGEIDYSQNEVEYSDKADFDSFISLFSVIRDRFLFSKFGIVTYLSTRIRHGVLLGELRPELEKHNIIFYKNKLKDRYEPNLFWINNPQLTRNEKDKLISIIASFSDKVDSLINKIIKENIQIKLDTDNPNGWFDYDFSYEELSKNMVILFYEEGYKAFCKKVLEILWIRTDQNLEEIRRILQEEIKPKFINILNDFESELSSLGCKPELTGIFTAISICSTSLQVKIDKIASWFKRSGKTHSDFELNSLIKIICSNVQKSHPLKVLSVNFNSDFNETIKGEFYEHFNDFIRIFIDNMLRHSAKNNINCNIGITNRSPNIEMVLENDSPSSETEIPIDDFGYGIEIDRLKLLTEGKSGLIKAVKTIKDDLKNDSNEIYFKPSKENFRVTVFINYTNLII